MGIKFPTLWKTLVIKFPPPRDGKGACQMPGVCPGGCWSFDFDESLSTSSSNKRVCKNLSTYFKWVRLLTYHRGRRRGLSRWPCLLNLFLLVPRGGKKDHTAVLKEQGTCVLLVQSSKLSWVLWAGEGMLQAHSNWPNTNCCDVTS